MIPKEAIYYYQQNFGLNTNKTGTPINSEL